MASLGVLCTVPSSVIQKEVLIVECIQRRMKKVHRPEGTSQVEQLRTLGLISSGKRRLRGGLTALCSFLRSIEKREAPSFSLLSGD